MAKQMCQSCGRPLKDEIRGTEADGSPSAIYCNLCYEKGSFKDPGMTIEQMQAVYVKAMQEMHFPAFIARLFAKSQLPKLTRWRSK
ncbi:MAG TPA: zinc ribbon domain-containing protein [Candidatus Saccharimonadales bacterium]|nr:zinc ribbon domain-containing protein [Candidatus Saccharimonadales bacterium]